MRLTKRQKNELVVWEYFIPSNCTWAKKTDKDIEIFFEWSEQGKHKDFMNIMSYKPEGRTYAHALSWGKKWAGIHCHELYEPGVLDLSFPYVCILGIGGYGPRCPVEVKDWLKKEMFKGIDADIIDKCYEMDY